MTGHVVVPGAGAPAMDGHGPEGGFYGRALADPLFLARFEAAYTGSDDPLDALWWFDRPGERAPSGAPSPTAAAAEARRALYGPNHDPAALERYEQVTAVAERSRTAAVAALGRLPATPAPPRLRTEQPRQEPERAAAPAATPARARGRLVLAAAVPVVLVLVAAAYAVGRVTSAPAPPPTLTEHFQQTVRGTDATTVFERAAEPADLLGGSLAPLDPVTLRRLVSIGPVRFLAARTSGDAAAICLIAAHGTDRLAARCVTDAEFTRAGVVLVSGDGLPTEFDHVRWQPDGALVWWSTTG